MISHCFEPHFPYPRFSPEKEGMEFEPIALFFIASLLAFWRLVGFFVCLCVCVCVFFGVLASSPVRDVVVPPRAVF